MADGDPIRVGQVVSGSLDGQETQVINNAPLLARNQGDTAGVIGESTRGPGVTGITEGATTGPNIQAGGVYGVARTGPGVRGESEYAGVAGRTSGTYTWGVLGQASANGGVGVFGKSSAFNGVGVWGEAYWRQNSARGSGVGILGEADWGGVFGISDAGTGVLGESNTGVGVAGGVYPDGLAGVVGNSFFSSPGVVGFSAAGEGVRGESESSWGVVGRSSGARGGVLGWSESPTDGGDGVWGISNSGVGVFGDGPIAGVLGVGEIGVWAIGNPAGYFQGRTYVHGDLVVAGAKSAAVPYRDGTHRLLYAMESPEAWFEDFGRGRLMRGKARVRLDPTFAGVVRTPEYHVFLRAEGESNGLYVRRRTATGFEVWERGGGRSGVGFSYRVVAKRKDIAGRRFEKVKPPHPVGPRLRVAEVRRGVRRGKRTGGLGISDLRPLITRVHATMQRATSIRSERRGEAGKRGKAAPSTRRR